tara:strand:- start:2838 stop:3191 length:354 start_codon:yes stop_codon:yes gene_type:complete
MAISTTDQTKLYGAIGSLNLIRILYSKKKKPNRIVTERVVRVVEPYEIKDGYLYAWDTTKDKKTKTFILDNISNVMVLGSKFKDRYPDGGKGFPTYESQNPPDARRMKPTVNTTAFV